MSNFENNIKLSESDKKDIIDFLETLEDQEDVQNVYANIA